MDLAALRAQARAVATRMDTRISAALTAGRDLSAEEETANTADEAERADLEAQLDEAIAGLTASGDAFAGLTAIVVTGSDDDLTALRTALEGAGAGHVVVTAAPASDATAERDRIMGLIDLCPTSAITDGTRTAIGGGQDAGAFAIALARDAKQRGASVDDLKKGAVQANQLPAGGTGGKPAKAGTFERGKEILARAAARGHPALAHLTTGG